jgi:predicted component of type VI protein secretion system
MKSALILFTMVATITSAFADDAEKLRIIQQTFGQKIIAEMNTALSCQMDGVIDRQKIATLENRVKELEEKYEAKPQ